MVGNLLRFHGYVTVTVGGGCRTVITWLIVEAVRFDNMILDDVETER